jgi:hypothetical protein
MQSAPFVPWASVLAGWAVVGALLYGLGCLVSRWLGDARDESAGPPVSRRRVRRRSAFTARTSWDAP